MLFPEVKTRSLNKGEELGGLIETCLHLLPLTSGTRLKTSLFGDTFAAHLDG